MTEIDQKHIALGLQAALNLAEEEDIQWPRRPDLSAERSQWISNLKPGDTICLHCLPDGHIETILEQVTVHEFTNWGFFVLRDTGGLLNIDKNGYVPNWGGKGWIAEL
jgi:hypothetical protein